MTDYLYEVRVYYSRLHKYMGAADICWFWRNIVSTIGHLVLSYFYVNCKHAFIFAELYVMSIVTIYGQNVSYNVRTLDILCINLITSVVCLKRFIENIVKNVIETLSTFNPYITLCPLTYMLLDWEEHSASQMMSPFFIILFINFGLPYYLFIWYIFQVHEHIYKTRVLFSNIWNIILSNIPVRKFCYV